MASWAGFSDEELRRLQQKEDHNEAVQAALGRGRRSAQTNRSRQQLQRERALQMSAKQNDGRDSSLLPEQQLKPPPPPSPKEITPNKLPEQQPKPVQPEPVKHSPQAPSEDPPLVVKELDKVEVELREKNRLQQLQWEQRMMEEKNKKRKALLAKTIAEKSKQTQAEAVKLKKIQKELQALDDSVSNDIAILRKLIEEASLEYSIAWKRLEKAEAEYVIAKLDLHKKTEVKEQLTEHLSAIIQQNELRKARKLEELMLKLELSAEEEAALESHTPQAAEEGEREKESLSEPAVVNGPTVGNEEKSQLESTEMNKDNSTTTSITTSPDQEREPITATEEDRS